jgi:hypothetical protein
VGSAGATAAKAAPSPAYEEKKLGRLGRAAVSVHFVAWSNRACCFTHGML